MVPTAREWPVVATAGTYLGAMATIGGDLVLAGLHWGVRTSPFFPPSHSPSSHRALPWPGDANRSRAHSYLYAALSLVGPTDEQTIHHDVGLDGAMERTEGVGRELRSKGRVGVVA